MFDHLTAHWPPAIKNRSARTRRAMIGAAGTVSISARALRDPASGARHVYQVGAGGWGGLGGTGVAGPGRSGTRRGGPGSGRFAAVRRLGKGLRRLVPLPKG